jgi:hypothetical protein
VKLKDLGALEKRLKQEPDNLGLRVQVAGLMREAGRSVEAVELYRSVALVYRDQGRTQQAIAVCRSILDIAPDDAACHGLLAMLQQRAAPPPATRASTPPPATRASTPPAVPEAARRASIEETPLPRPIPYHVADPTSQPNRIDAEDLELEDRETRPGAESPRERRDTAGLAQAARHISGLISDDDADAEVDTRQLPRLEPTDHAPPTEPMQRISDEELTGRPAGRKLARESDDELTLPHERSSADDD